MKFANNTSAIEPKLAADKGDFSDASLTGSPEQKEPSLVMPTSDMDRFSVLADPYPVANIDKLGWRLDQNYPQSVRGSFGDSGGVVMDSADLGVQGLELSGVNSNLGTITTKLDLTECDATTFITDSQTNPSVPEPSSLLLGKLASVFAKFRKIKSGE